MEKEFNQNTRTLIVSFVVALMVLIPLRFVEFSNSYSSQSILGESVELVTDDDCLSDEYVDEAVSLLINETDVEGISDIQAQDILNEITKFESSRCQ
jgi:hypothetical protein